MISNIFGDLPVKYIEESIFNDKISSQINDFMRDSKLQQEDDNNIDDNYNDTVNQKNIIINKVFEEKKWENVNDNINIDDSTNKYEDTFTGESIANANKSQPWDFRQNDDMVDDSTKLLNKNNENIDEKLRSQIIIASRGDINWQYFAEWLTENAEIMLSNNFIEINSETGEI